MACLWDVLRAFKYVLRAFDCLQEFIKIFLISFQKVKLGSLVGPSLPGDLLFSILIKD